MYGAVSRVVITGRGIRMHGLKEIVICGLFDPVWPT